MSRHTRSSGSALFRTRPLDELRAIHDRETDRSRRATLRERARLQAIRAGLTPPA